MSDPSDQKGGGNMLAISEALLVAVRQIGREMLATGQQVASIGAERSTMAVATDRALLRTVIASVEVDGKTLFVGLPSDPTPTS